MDNPLVQTDPGLFIWTIVTFLVLLALLAKFAWRPLLQALEQRQEAIRKSLDDVRQAKQDLEPVNISVAIASKLLQRNVSREDNERLIEDTFRQLESTPHA